MMYWCDKSAAKPLLSSDRRGSQEERGERKRHPNSRRKHNNNNSLNNYKTADSQQLELEQFPDTSSGSARTPGEDYDDDGGAYAAKSIGLNTKMVLERISLLLWKNLLFRRRHYIVTTLEVILPTLLAMTIAYMRTVAPEGVTLDKDHNTTYPVVPEQASLSHAANVLSTSRYDHHQSIVAFTPNNPVTKRIMEKVKGNLPGATFDLRGFSTEEEIEIYMAQMGLNISTGGRGGDEPKVRAVIVFPENLNFANFPQGYVISYTIRLVDVPPLENTKELFPLFQFPGPNTANVVNYQNAGFTGLQVATDKALIWILTGVEPSQTMNSQAFPYPSYSQSLNFNMIYFIILPQLMVLGFIFIVPSIIRNIVSEKETGIKELMKMMGLPNYMHWMGWMLNSLVVLTFSISIVTALFFIPFDSHSGAVMVYSDPSLWWFVLFLYSMAATSFCFLISTFFQRPTLATTVGIVLWLVTYYVPVQSMEPKYQFLSFSQKMFSALLPNVALHWVIKVICGFEGKSVGARWSNIAEAVSSTDELSVGYGCLMLILDTLLYTLLTIYFENVIPSEFGIRKPWYYPFQASTWGRESKRRVSSVESQNDDGDRRGFEREPMELRAGVVIHNLKKRFGRNKVAVNMVGTLKMYDGQITALLGHNGAGKTTTLSMLTGLFAPSSGTATVNGYDITTNMASVRKNLGLCPQHNMLFDKLTVEEHLIFFGRLKGLNKSEAKREMKTLLDKLQLREKRRTLAGAISGGQKRKLSLGIALIGGTKVVILDEPTSGMDPEARRAIWDLLLEMRGERTIILTTHFMEEADVLGDRIAIMADGKVKCCGSPLFLKKYYGAGYTLKMTVKDVGVVGSLLRAVQNHIPNAFEQNGRHPNSTEVAITIPNESNTNAKFPELFSTLTDCKEELGIQTVGLSLATMDEIFVKVGEENGNDEDGSRSSESEPMNVIENRSKATDGLCKGRRMTGLRLTFQQFNGLLRKRVVYTLRKRKLFISQFLMPLGLLIVSILLSNTSFSPATTVSPLKMELSVYKNPVTLFRASTQSLGDAYKNIIGSSAVSMAGDLVEELITIGGKDLGAFREKYILAGDLNETSVTAMFSSIPNHASPLSVNLMSNAILGTTQGSKGYRIEVTTHPLQSGLTTLLEPANPNPVFSTVVPILFGVLLPIGLSLFAASYIVYPVEEKLCKAKQLQLMTGVSPVVFWGSSFVWDFCLMFFLICLMLLCFPIFQSYGAFTVYNGGGVIFLILMVYGFSAISFSYLCSTFVETVPGGFSLVSIVHIITGMILSLVVFLMETTGLADKVGHVRSVGRLFPTFGASVSIMRFTSIATKNSRCNILTESVKNLICSPNGDVQPELRQCCPNCASFQNPNGPNCFEPQPYLTWTFDLPNQYSGGLLEGETVPGIGQNLLYLFLIGLLYKTLLMIIEYGLVQRILALLFKSNPSIFKERRSEDEDVVLETQRVAAMVSTGRVGEDALVVENLCRSYGSFAAVSGLSFGVHHGECFGLLGVNGAGKTTSFRMLTGDEFRSYGNAFGMNRTLEKDRKKFLSLIGYCPQFDGIVGVLTGKEMLELFCRLRGVEPAGVEREASKWLLKLGLLESGNVQCQKYSGGMKRRLCAAIALVGDPPIILLDEPTSGVDPIARRQFWKVISSVRDSGQAVVLTSHSMEECEALCSRLGIMVNGHFQCLGGVQHLKNKYAQGFRLMIKLKTSSVDEAILSSLCGEITIKFHPCSLKDKHQNILEYQVMNTGISWGQIFKSMEQLRGEYAEVIEDYSVSETTLEEVFLSFARKQYPGRDVEVSFLKKLVTCECCK